MSTDGQIIDIHLISYLLRVGTSNLKSRKSSYIDNVNIHHSFPFNTHIVFYLTLWWEGCLHSPHITTHLSLASSHRKTVCDLECIPHVTITYRNTCDLLYVITG